MCGFRLQLATPGCSYFRTRSADLLLFASWTKVSWVGLRWSLTVTLICICECSCSRHSMPSHSSGGGGSLVNALLFTGGVGSFSHWGWCELWCSPNNFLNFLLFFKLKYNHILPPSLSSNPCHGSNPTTFFFEEVSLPFRFLRCCYKTLELLSNDVCTLLGWLWFSSILSVNEGILCPIMSSSPGLPRISAIWSWCRHHSYYLADVCVFFVSVHTGSWHWVFSQYFCWLWIQCSIGFGEHVQRFVKFMSSQQKLPVLGSLVGSF